MKNHKIFIGIDIGGTFTDFIIWENNDISSFKILSTPENPEIAVLEGLNLLFTKKKEREIVIIHGSTVATNALLERKGAKTALITTKGFEDIIEIGRQNRNSLYNLRATKVPPLVPEKLRFGIDERIDYKGEVLKPPELGILDEFRSKIKELSIESIAVCFLFSYINPSHEEIIYNKIKDLGIPISLSSRILPEYREFERFSTVTANAFIAPKMCKYLKNLEKKDDGENHPWELRILQSNGGTIKASLASEEPVRTVLSGPAGGVVASNFLAHKSGYSKIITFDMGGTSTDVSLCDGKETLTTDGKVGGYPIKIPLIDIHTVGAGGGSIAYIDRGGMLRVGPRSAGSNPGPICFGRGGSEPTVTDAQLILGRIDNKYFWDGKLSLDRKKTRNIFKYMAKKLNISSLELAIGIVKIANSSMERALKVISMERGYDPRDFTLVCFGGGGPLHACNLARELSIPRIMVPPNAGTLSAFGMIVADIIRDYSKTIATFISKENIEKIDNAFFELESKIKESFHHNEQKIEIQKFIDLRYSGQSYELTVPYNKNFQKNFHELHLKRFHHNYPDKALEAVNIRIKVIKRTKKPEFINKDISQIKKIKPVKMKKVFWDNDYIDTPVYLRELLKPGIELFGPSLIFEKTTTIAIPPGFHAIIDRLENIIISE